MNAQTNSLFKERHTLEYRKQLYLQKQLIHPLKILIILENAIGTSNNIQLCAADPDQLMVTFQAEITKLLKKNIPKTNYVSLFFFIDNIIPQKDLTMKEIHDKMQNKDDGFLYIQVKSLETLGSLN